MNFSLLTQTRLASRNKLAAGFLLLALLLPFTKVEAATVTPRIEINANAGDTVREVFKVSNEERESKTFYLSFENFQSVDESGNPSFTGGRTDLASWISGPESVTVGPGDSAEVPVTIVIPGNAEAGGHFAAIFLQTTPPGQVGSGQVGVNSKLGSLILLRVGGDFEQGGAILEFATQDHQRFFTSLPVTFYYRFQNTGDDHIKPLGDVQITNTFGMTSKLLAANPVDGSVLPKSTRRIETSWITSGKPLKQPVEVAMPENTGKGFFGKAGYQLKHFAFGKYSAKLKLVYGTQELKSTNASYTFFVFPWQLIVVVLVGLGIVLPLLWMAIKRYNRYIIGKATNKRSRR